MVNPTRIPLYAPLSSRDSSTDKDSLTSNLFYDKGEESVYATKRPGIETLITGSGQGQGIYFFDNQVFRWETNPFTWLAATFKEDSILAVTPFITSIGGITALSTGGRTWEVGGFGDTATSTAFLTTDGIVFTLLSGTQVFQSSDNITWTLKSTISLGGFPALQWGGSVYVATTGSDAFKTSSDAITWTDRSDADLSGISTGPALTYGNGKFVGIKSSFGSTTKGVISTDGISWTETTMSSVFQSAPPSAITFGNGKFVAVSSNISTPSATGYHSTDGSSWTVTSLPISIRWRSVAWNGSVFIAVGNSSLFAFSTDGLTWNLGEIPFLTSFNIVIANPTTGVIAALSDVSPKGYARSEDNGLNWTYANLPSADTTTGTITTP